LPSLLIHGARQVLTLRGACFPRRGSALRNLSIIEDGSILIEDGKVRDVGPTRRIENLAIARKAREISARGRTVMPGFVDCHMRLISAPGRDVMESDAATHMRNIRQTPAWRLADDAMVMLRRCIRYGTTTLDVKAGAGLDETSEMKVLRIIADLAKQQPIELIPTFCGGTALPAGGEETADAYVERLVNKTLPAIREKQLASFVAVSSDPSIFSEVQRRTLLDAVAGLPLGLKIHGCGIAMAVARKAATIEFLEQITRNDINLLAASETIAILTPTLGFHYPERGFAPARELIAAGAAVALASGYDRAVSPSFSMPITIELACRKLGMAPSEAIVAATLNAAFAVGRGAVTGSIEPGKNADVLILETSDYRDLAYETGFNPVDVAIVRGEVACQNSVSYGAAAKAASAS